MLGETVSTDECQEWDGSLNSGYGRKSVKGKLVYVHRMVWEEENGPIPEGIHVLHKCDNKPCILPEHLFLGTLADNNRDRSLKGRSGNPWPSRRENGTALRTHCKAGHELNEKTRYWRPDGKGSSCKICNALRTADHQKKARVAIS